VSDSTSVTEHIQWPAGRIMRRTEGKRLIILLHTVDRLDDEELITLRELFEPYCPSEKSVKSDERLFSEAKNSESLNPDGKKSFQSVQSVGEKIDTNSVNSMSSVREENNSVREKEISVRNTSPQIIEISAKQSINTTQLTQLLYESAQMPDLSAGDIIISNLRHYEALTHALESIDRVIDGLQTNIPADFVAQDIREALFHLAEITGGEITTDEVLGNIFAHFCIGK
jgi:tRNA U34 5-carboxymethylaminomethyl modifying GTPase MnmE/TrmE